MVGLCTNFSPCFFGYSLLIKQKYQFVMWSLCSGQIIGTRGGVEDTRLEAKAKAKDTKKIRGQGQGQGQPFRGQTLSRPRTGMLEAKDRNARGQGQGPRTQSASALQKKKKKVFTKIFQAIFTKIFQAISTKKRFPKNFSTAPQNFNTPKNRAVLEPIFEDLRPRGQGQGLDLRGQGQGLQNLSSRTPPLIGTAHP